MNTNPLNYVVGFLFNSDRTQVALVEKQKPEWQRGKLNGIGGKIEGDDESPTDAMTREFREETGATVLNWRWFCELKFRGGSIYFFAAIGDLNALETKEAEQIVVRNVSEIRDLQAIPNLRWLIPLALDKDEVTAIVQDNS